MKTLFLLSILALSPQARAWGGNCNSDCAKELSDRIDALKAVVQSQADTLVQVRANAKIPPGTILPYAGGALPERYLPADGRAVDCRDDHFVPLCQALGDQFRRADEPPGVVRLPDLRGRVPMGEGHGEELSDRVLGTRLGFETQPEHTHVYGLIGHQHIAPRHNHIWYAPGGGLSIQFGGFDAATFLSDGTAFGIPYEPRSRTLYTTMGGDSPTSGAMNLEAGSKNTSVDQGGNRSVIPPSLVVKYLVKY